MAAAVWVIRRDDARSDRRVARDPCRLRGRGTPLYALSNFSAETYPSTFARFEFLRWFRGIVVSGEVRAIKPEPEIYRALIETYAIDWHPIGL